MGGIKHKSEERPRKKMRNMEEQETGRSIKVGGSNKKKAK
jgi:hypothetical protein